MSDAHQSPKEPAKPPSKRQMHPVVNAAMSGAKFVNAKTSKNARARRILTVVLGCLALAVLCFGAGMLWWLFDTTRSYNAQEWLLPMFLSVFFLVMAGFMPFVPIWMVNVPDGEVWMILDSTDHFERFVESGVHPIRPVQNFLKHEGKGMVAIPIKLEQIVTSDHFPYDVTCSITVVFNPMNAEKSMWKSLRYMSKEAIRVGIEGDVTDIVKRHMYQFGRQEVDPLLLIDTIQEAVRDAVAMRSKLGVALTPGNAIKISLDPPKEVMDSRRELWQEESRAKARVLHLVEMVKASKEHNVEVSDLGRLHFLLNPQVGTRLNLLGGHDLFPNAQPALPPPKQPKLTSKAAETVPRPAVQMPKIEAPANAAPGEENAVNMPPPPADPTPPRAATENPMSPNLTIPSKPPEPPMDLPEPIPPRPAKKDSDVIETVQDEKGVYVPRNPILRRAKSKTGSQKKVDTANDGK